MGIKNVYKKLLESIDRKSPEQCKVDFDFWLNSYCGAKGIFVGQPILSKGMMYQFSPDVFAGLHTPIPDMLFEAIKCLVNIVANNRGENTTDTIESHQKLVEYKNAQYGDIIQNPVLYTIHEHEIEIVVRGLINNKINRIKNQTDDEDAYADLMGYLIHLYLLEEKK